MEDLLLKIQKLPQSKRKIIFWAIIVILTLILLSFYIKNTRERFKNIEMEEFKKEFSLPSLEEQFKKIPAIEIPKIEMPEINQEKLQELEQTIKEGQI